MRNQNTPFPVNVLPECMRNYVSQGAEAIGCHESYIALPLLASLAKAIGNKRTIQLTPTWQESAIIWGAIVSDSGELKTPAQELATSFLRQLEKASGKDYTSTDATYAGLRDCLEDESDTSMLLMPDELIEVFQGLGRGGQSHLKKGQWLSCWHGTELKILRYKKRTVIERAAVSIIGGIQPSVFRDLVRNQRQAQNGLCARFLLTWQPQEKPRTWDRKQIGFATNEGLSAVFLRLLKDMPANLDESGKVTPTKITMSEGAQAHWEKFFDRHNAQGFKLDHDLKAAWSKLEAYAARFALIFELVDWAYAHCYHPKKADTKNVKVSAETLQNAVELTEWFKQQARRVYNELFNETPQDGARRELIALIERNDGRITSSQLRRNSNKYKTEPDATKALTELVTLEMANWKIETHGSGGGRPARTLVLNEPVAKRKKKSKTKTTA